MKAIEKLKDEFIQLCKENLNPDIDYTVVKISRTNPDFHSQGDYSFNFNAIKRHFKLSPIEFGEKMLDIAGQALGSIDDGDDSWVFTQTVLKGFINFKFSSRFWLKRIEEISAHSSFGTFPPNGQNVLLEYCGPNTNKPLHIGHVRNMLLGFSMSKILKATGHDVTKVNIYNDRGIAISKSMVAYKKLCAERGDILTPFSEGKKGDRFVGDCYVYFNEKSAEQRKEFNENVQSSINSIVGSDEIAKNNLLNNVPGLKNIISILNGDAENKNEQTEETKAEIKNFKDNPDTFLRKKLIALAEIRSQILNNTDPQIIKCYECIEYLETLIINFLETSLFSEAVITVQKWEDGDIETRLLWKEMNNWVYDGFQETFDLLGVDFQKDYYESETYKLGRDLVNEGLEKGIFYKRADGAVAVDLTPEGLDEKVLLRADGTSIYITQDLATAKLRHEEFNMDKMVYVVANEQDYHFKVLKLALQKLGYKWADGIYHLSYALVESPTGRFKSREGKTADADDLIAEVLRIAEEKTKELGKIEGFTGEEADALYKTIGLGALKYFVLRVNPYKKIIFNPEESIDFHGHTGPFIQYTNARIAAIMRKAVDINLSDNLPAYNLTAAERELIILMSEYENVVKSASDKYDPSEIANYAYNLARLYNKFYHESPILSAPTEDEKLVRVALSSQTGAILKKAMKLLGIDVPEKM